MTSSFKRSRHQFDLVNDEQEQERAWIATYLTLLAQTRASLPPKDNCSENVRIFECKTCSRRFSSFQALGGHRASHKKPRLGSPAAQSGPHSSSDNSSISNDSLRSERAKKAHECAICGAGFALGQALGGHMRRHRAAVFDEGLPSTVLCLSISDMCRPGKKKDRKIVAVGGGGGADDALCLDLSL